MTLGVPADEGGYRDAPTVPLVAGSGPGGSTEYQGAQRTLPLGIPRGTPRRSRLPRLLRRCLIVVLALALAFALTFVTMLIVTPSVSNAPNGGTEMLASDHANNLLFATNSQQGTITTYRIDDRTDALTPAESLALPGDSEPFGIAVDAVHQRAYVSDRAAGLVYVFSYDRSGRLKQSGGPATSESHPGTLVLGDAGQSRYAVDAVRGAVLRFSLQRGQLTLSHVIPSAPQTDPATRAGSEPLEDVLSESMAPTTGPSSPSLCCAQPGSNVSAGDPIGAAIVDPAGRFGYTTDQLTGMVRVFRLEGGCASAQKACLKMIVPAEDPPSRASRPLGIALTR